MSFFIASHLLQAITTSLKQLLRRLEDIQKRIHKHHVIKFENDALALLDASEKMTVVRRFSEIDAHLRNLQKLVVREVYKQNQELVAELVEPCSNLADFELDAELSYVLAEDNPLFKADGDNILATRHANVTFSKEQTVAEVEAEIDTDNFNDRSTLMPKQGWFLHDICDHGYGLGSPRLSEKKMLNVGFVWVDIITTRQYFLNLRSGKFEKVRSEN